MESKQTSSKVLDFLTSPLTGQRRKEKPVSVQMAETGIDFTPVGTVSAIVEDPSLSNIAMQVAPDVLGLGPVAKAVIKKSKAADAEKALAMIESQDLRDAWVKNKRKELGISDADKDYSSRDLVSKQEVKRRQTRKFPEQIKALESGKMSGPEYRRYIRENQPATKFTKEDVQTMLTSYEDMVGGLDALGQNKAAKGIIGLTDNVEKGAEVAARLDIPAYNKRDIWVAQITGAGKNMYGRTAVLKNVKFFIEGKDAARRSKKMRDVGKGEKDKSPFATMKGEWQDLSDEDAFKKAIDLVDDPEWIQVGFNPERHSFFYDKDTMMPVFEAEEVIQVGPLVLAKKAKLGNKRIDPETGKESSFVPAERIKKIRELKIEDRPGKPTTFNQGGIAMDDQMEMAFMNEGGIADDGMDVDPVSGNEVPPGSLAEEVRDDIPAQLSEGEYVVPADVVRYYGVKFFEDLRDQAKMGLAQMEADGRIGGEPVPDGGPVNDKELSPQEMQAIQEMMGMAEGGEVQNPYLQQQQLYSQPRPAPIDEKRNTTITNVNPVENQMPMQSMASGGQVQGYQGGGAETTTPSYAQNIFSPGTYGLGFSFMGQQPQQTTMATTPGTTTPSSTTSTTPGGTTAITPVTSKKPTLTLYGPNGEIRTFFNLPLSDADAAEVKRLKEEEGYSETQTVTPVKKETKPETKDPVSSELMKKVFGEEKKKEPVNFKDEKSIKDAIGDYHSSGPLKGALLTGAINPGAGLLTYFTGSKSQDKQKDYLLKGIDERLSSPLDPPEKLRLEKLRQELLDKDTYEASINKKSKELGLFDGFLDKVKGSLTNEDIKVVKDKYNNSSKDASDAWQNATKLKNSLHPRDDPIAYHKAVKAQSEASRAFTALKRAETAKKKAEQGDDYEPSSAPEPTTKYSKTVQDKEKE